MLKRKLSNSFEMKDLGVVKQILGMRIARDKKNHKLTLSQGEHIDKVLAYSHCSFSSFHILLTC